ncbi:uncharacterized protein [Pyxicephalus adspersus]|uniref:uncharacterized protein isoform X2 n=1 Tax=Pyxicephalus adspersus TaxID=30357 RepID=UPI003B5951B7
MNTTLPPLWSTVTNEITIQPLPCTDTKDHTLQSLPSTDSKVNTMQPLSSTDIKDITIQPLPSTDLKDTTIQPLNSTDMKDITIQPTRKCKLKPRNYADLLESDQEFTSGRIRHKGARSSLQVNMGKRPHKEFQVHIPKGDIKNLSIKQKWIKEAVNVAVKLEFPKQLFNDEFIVRCGNKKGIFMKKYWKGDPSHDFCIKCDKQMFTVINFEKYGGRLAAKSWKRTIRCSGITMEKIIQADILKTPINNKSKAIIKRS